jgi:enoyl-CoA hydratase/carnithine racemase
MSIKLDIHGHIALITIGRPEKRGALDRAGYAALANAWRTIGEDPALRVAVITGTGASYCAGTDLSEFAQQDAGFREEGSGPGSIREIGTMAVLHKVDFPKPIVAAVGGPCMGSGMEMLLATDIRIASPNARFCVPEVRRGLFPGGGAALKLPKQIPHTHAMDMLLTGRTIGADEALAIGLIGMVVEPEELLEEAIKKAELIAANSPVAVQSSKLCALEGMRLSLEEAYAAEKIHVDRVFGGPDAKEGPRAFMEKRLPQWASPQATEF